MAAGTVPAASTQCPPHPGFMGGICIRCGALKGEAEEQGVALTYIHRGLVVSKHEAERVRQVRRLARPRARPDQPAPASHSQAAAAWLRRAWCRAVRAKSSPPGVCGAVQGTADRLLAHRKLLLILDLDHTLLNSTRFTEVPPQGAVTEQREGGRRWQRQHGSSRG